MLACAKVLKVFWY